VTATRTETTSPRVDPPPSPSVSRPSNEQIAAAICAEKFYADAFGSRDKCEAKLVDPKAVAALKRGVQGLNRDIEASKRRLKTLDRNGDGRIDAGSQP
jgi:hypothetical protein